MGDVTAAVAARANYTVGVELKEELIAVARERHKGDGLEFICMDAVTYLSSEESGFDVLILSHILEHIEDPEQFLRKFSGFFKRVYIEVPDFDASLLNHYRQDLNLQLNYCDPDHVSEFDRNEIQEILDRCGLDVEATEYIFGVQRYWCKVIKA